MQEPASKSREHRLRVLEHQARMAGERPAPSLPLAVQGKIPLLVEVKARESEKPKPARRRRKKRPATQARFEGL